MNRRQQRKRSKYCSTPLATLCSLVQVSCQKDKFLRATTALRPPGLVSCRLVFWPFVHDFTKIDLWGETRRFCHRGRQGQRVEEPKGPRVKASQAGLRSDKMRWVLSIVSWSAMQDTEPAVGRRPSPRRCPAEMAADRERVTVLAEASGWYLSRVAKERIPARRDAAVCVGIVYLCTCMVVKAIL